MFQVKSEIIFSLMYVPSDFHYNVFLLTSITNDICQMIFTKLTSTKYRWDDTDTYME